ncbi:MAG TPA: serine hydrolase domain-containing protein [Allosphingosinicella sp.]|nr:serine hydrolase domain-containing protein [Allosphingosinicella sp.]
MIGRLFLLWIAAAAPAAAQLDAGREARIDRAVTSFMARERVPSVAVVALRDDAVLLRRGWGAGSVDRIQPIYSVSKHITAALVVDLARRGQVDLDAPVGRYLPKWFADEPDLKLHHLLHQTSGLAEFVRLPEALAVEAAPAGTGSLADLVRLIDHQPRRFRPGARHAYSNANFTLLALIAERRGADSFDALQRRRLFAPLGLRRMGECAGMDRTDLAPGHGRDGGEVSLPPNPHPTFAGNGGICASATELARWMRALGSGRLPGGPLVRGMRSGPRVKAGYRPPYAFGLSLKPLLGSPAYWHAGVDEGWAAFAAYLPRERLTLIVLADRGWLWTTDVALPILRALLDRPEPEPLERLALTGLEREALNGEYEDGLFNIAVKTEADRLWLSVPAFGEPIEMWRQRDERFVSPARPDTFSLRLGAHGPELDWAEHRSYLVRKGGQRP